MHSHGVLDRQRALFLEYDDVVLTILDRFSALPVFQSAPSDAPPVPIRRCSMVLPRGRRQLRHQPGRSLCAVKLLPMKRTFMSTASRIAMAELSRGSVAEYSASS